MAVHSKPPRPALIDVVITDDLAVDQRIALASQIGLSPMTLMALAEDESEAVARAADVSPSRTDGVKIVQAMYASTRVKARMAADPATSPDLLLMLAQVSTPEVRAAVADNPATPPAGLEQILATTDDLVRSAAANQGVDIATLMHAHALAGDQIARRMERDLGIARTNTAAITAVRSAGSAWFNLDATDPFVAHILREHPNDQGEELRAAA